MRTTFPEHGSTLADLFLVFRVDDHGYVVSDGARIPARLYEARSALPSPPLPAFPLPDPSSFSALPTQCNTLAKMPKSTGSPRVIVLAGAALRVADLCRCAFESTSHGCLPREHSGLTTLSTQRYQELQDQDQGRVDRRRETLCQGASSLAPRNACDTPARD